MFKKNRYFLVFYNGVCEDKSIVNGNCDFTVRKGHFINSNDTISQLKKVQRKKVESLVLTNIIEMSKSDFKDWKASFSSTEP